MNDFAKGELKEIKTCVYSEGYRPDGEENANQVLLDKIQLIIDKYCEHDWHEGSMGSIYCKNCKHRINFKIQGF